MEETPASGAASSHPSPFPPTLWTVVLEASAGEPEAAAVALRKLVSIYRDPILSFLIKRGIPRDKAEDQAQGFAEFLLERNRLHNNFARGQSKFRSFLIGCLQGFLRDEWRKSTAQKRGSGVEPITIDDCEPAVPPELATSLDRDFAVVLHRRALERLREKSARRNQEQRFHALQRFVLGTDYASSYVDVGIRLQMTPGAVKKAVFDLREAYCDAFRTEVAQTVSAAAVEEEMRYLFTLLAEVEGIS